MPEELFRLGRYWIARVAGSANLYRFWYDAGAGEVRRRSLGTADLEQAKLELAAIVLKEGPGRAAEPRDVLLIAPLTRYWEEHSDKKRDKATPRRAGRYLLDFLGENARVTDFTRARQVEFIKSLYARGLKPGSISRLMAFVQAALNRAVAVDDDDPRGLLTRAPKLLYQPKAVAEVLNAPEPEPNTWHPDIPMIARWLDGLEPNEEHIRRWTILMIGFGGCRAEAALEAGPFQLDANHRLIRLNPHGRRQSKKYRPTIPVAEVLWPLLEAWSTTATFVGHAGKNYPYEAWNAARARMELPDAFNRRSLRHFMATELRHAHVRHGVERVPADEREMMMGHRRATTNTGYGVFEPDFLATAKAAVNAILIAIDRECKRPFLRQGSAKSGHAEQSKTRLKVLK